jgi:ABC-type Mn2+/Zn2+ transport system permease subunit
MFVLSSLFGLISGLGGLHFSLAVDVPASSAIIIVASIIIILCLIYKKRFVRYGKNL